MQRILIVGGHSSSNTDVEELKAFGGGIAQSSNNATCDTTTADALYFVIAPGEFRVHTANDGSTLEAYDLVILRNKMRTYSNIAYLLSRYCAVQGKAFFNDYSQYFPATKVAQAAVFYEQAVPFIKTVYSMDRTTLASAIKKELSLPFILKDSQGAKGASNYLVQTFAQLQEILKQEPDVDFIAQSYLPNDCDYRILLLGSQVLVIKRQGKGDSHLNNTSLGGDAVLVDVSDFPAEIIAYARRLAASMGLTIAGVDVMPHKDTGEYYVLETNAQPQIFTGAFLDEKQQAMTAFLKEFNN